MVLSMSTQPAALTQIHEALAAYRPRDAASYWDASGSAFAINAVLRAKPQDEGDALRLLRSVAPFVLWAHEQDLPEHVEAVFTPDRLEEYLSTGARAEWVSNTFVTVKWAIRRVGVGATKRAPWTPKLTAPKDEKLSVPYSQSEIDWYRAAADNQATARRSRYMRAALAMHHGAGVKHNELRFIVLGDLSEGDGHYVLTLTDQHTRLSRMPNRVVAVDAAYNTDIAELLSEASTGTLAYRHVGSDSYDPLKVVRREIEVPAALPTMDPRRLRNTWIANLLNRRLPLRAVLEAAGLQTLDLSLFLPFLVDADLPRSRRGMAGLDLTP